MFRVVAAGAAALLVFGLVSCAPEPEEIAGANGKSSATEKGSETASDSPEPEVPDDTFEKRTDLPASFPSEFFPIPEDAVIDDTGQREDSWFVVISAPDQTTADTYWNRIIADGHFAVADLSESDIGDRTATLTSPDLEVAAVMMPQTDGTILLNYDIESPQ
ncbi:MAG: hypothetical protein ACK5LO_14320 [Leucobacter sp.]